MKLIIGITGASGSIYAYNLLKNISKKNGVNCEIIFSELGAKVWEYELQRKINDCFGFKIHKSNDFFASAASGSSKYDAMIICPCSMGTLSSIANGISNNLICRSADVMLKERKRLLLVIREAPYNLIHIENMKKATEAGAIIHPASPYFYNYPQNIEEVIETITLRLLNHLGIHTNLKKWEKQL